MFSGGGDGPLGAVVGADTPETPEFDFEVAKTVAITTAPQEGEKPGDGKEAKAAAEPAAEAIVAALDTFYTEAFLDPANWQDGTYDEAFEAFSADARAEAEDQLETLTAGTGATELETIRPLDSTLKTKVLVDPKNLPVAVIGTVKFQASGNQGTDRFVFSSKGQYVFQKIDGDWTIVSFSVSRNDKEQSRPSGSATPSPTEASS